MLSDVRDVLSIGIVVTLGDALDVGDDLGAVAVAASMMNSEAVDEASDDAGVCT